MGCDKLKKFRATYPGEDLLGVYMDENYMCIKHLDHNIYLSFAQRGKALCIHFSSDKKGLRHLKPCFVDFCDFVRCAMPWCTMLISAARSESIFRFAKKNGFKYLMNHDEHIISVRLLQ